MEIQSIQEMLITNLGSLHQHNAKNAQKSKRLSPNERKYADKWKDTKFEIDTLFILLMLDFPFNNLAIVNLGGFLSAWLTLLHQPTVLHDKRQFFCIPSS